MSKKKMLFSRNSIDIDAQLFIDAANITDALQQSAINSLVIKLKEFGIWSKMKAIYPFIGGNSFSHKFNLKNPLDTDEAFRAVFNGNITHSSNGIKGDGVSGFIDTKLSPSLNLNINSISMAIYSRTLNPTNHFFSATSTSPAFSYIQFIANPPISDCYNATGTSARVSYSQLNGSKFYAMSILPQTIKHSVYTNGILNNSKLGTSGTPPVNNIIILSQGGAGSFSNISCAFASIGDGLTDIENNNLFTSVQEYQTTLNRQV